MAKRTPVASPPPTAREKAITTSWTLFTFDGDHLHVFRGDGQIHVALQPICKVFGVDFFRELQKIDGDPSILMSTLPDVDPAGVASLDLVSLPLWLATLDAQPELRDKLVRYKRGCAEELADHFLGRREHESRAPSLSRQLASIERALAGRPPSELNWFTSQVEGLARLLLARPGPPLPDPRGFGLTVYEAAQSQDIPAARLSALRVLTAFCDAQGVVCMALAQLGTALRGRGYRIENGTIVVDEGASGVMRRARRVLDNLLADGWIEVLGEGGPRTYRLRIPAQQHDAGSAGPS
jgi:hypothetical protein